MSEPQPAAPAVVLFDGECNLCHGVVQFCLRRDRRGRLRFAALRSRAAAALLAAVPAPQPLPDSLVLIAGGRVHLRSGAALRIAGRLSFPWWLGAALLLVPWPLRDFAYDFVARRRQRWFGRTASCLAPQPAWRERFLDADEPGQTAP